MAMKRITSDSSDATLYAKNVVDKLNREKTGKKQTKMQPVIFNMYPEEKNELNKIFTEMGITSFASGVRIALTEFKKNHPHL